MSLKLLILLAGELGFEPRLNDPESFVLPLHYSPVLKNAAPVMQYSIFPLITIL